MSKLSRRNFLKGFTAIGAILPFMPEVDLEIIKPPEIIPEVKQNDYSPYCIDGSVWRSGGGFGDMKFNDYPANLED